uniref:Uncharacterized protein n=1 Tax=Moniliophthora roreri TaxID=221103 RepID=A0A0W0GCT4_MONRR
MFNRSRDFDIRGGAFNNVGGNQHNNNVRGVQNNNNGSGSMNNNNGPGKQYVGGDGQQNIGGRSHQYIRGGSGSQNIGGTGSQHNVGDRGRQYNGCHPQEWDDHSQEDSHSSLDGAPPAHQAVPVVEAPAARQADRLVDAVRVDDPAVAVALKRALELYFSQPADGRPKLNLKFFSSLDEDLSDEQVMEVKKRFGAIEVGDPVIATALKVALSRYFTKPAGSRPKLNFRFFSTLHDDDDYDLTDEQVIEVQKRFRDVFPL